MALLSYLSVMADVITLRLTLVGADDKLKIVLLQELLCHIRAKVTASSSIIIHSTTILRDGITP